MDLLVAEGLLKQAIDLSRLPGSSAVHLESAIRTILQRNKDGETQREALLDRSRTMVYEYERCADKLEKSELSRATLAKEQALATSRMTNAQKELQAESHKLALAKEDLQKTRNALANVKALSAQDLKRRERETAAVLQKWQKLSSLPQHHSLDSIHQSNLRHSSSPAASTSSTEPQIELLTKCLQDAEAARQDLLQENQEWRCTFSSAVTSLSSALVEAGVSVPEVSFLFLDCALTKSSLKVDTSYPSPETAADELHTLVDQVQDSLSTFADNYTEQRRELQEQVARIGSMHEEERNVWQSTKEHHLVQVEELEGQLSMLRI